MDIFKKFADLMDAGELAKVTAEIAEINRGVVGYREVPLGRYEVEVSKLECKMSKQNNPMVSIWFRILEGEYKGSLIFYNGVFYEDWMRHRVAKILSDLTESDYNYTAGINLILKHGDVGTVNELCMELHEEIDGNFEYLLEYGKEKGYNTYKILKAYDMKTGSLPF